MCLNGMLIIRVWHNKSSHRTFIVTELKHSDFTRNIAMYKCKIQTPIPYEINFTSENQQKLSERRQLQNFWAAFFKKWLAIITLDPSKTFHQHYCMGARKSYPDLASFKTWRVQSPHLYIHWLYLFKVNNTMLTH